MIRGLALAVLAAVLVSALCWPVYGFDAAFASLEILGPMGVATALLAQLIARGRARVGGLRRQLALLAVLVLVELGAAVLLFTELMFVSAHDAFFTGLVVGYAALIGMLAARVVGRRALADVERVRSALDRVGAGDRVVRLGIGGGDELAALAADVDAMVTRLAAEERARRQLIAAVSHDLRTPITALQLLADAIDDDLVDPATRRQYAGRMGTHVRQLASLIDDLFELSRLEAGDIHWTMEQVRIADVLEETVEAMRPQAERGGVSVRAELPTEALARANPEQLQRVLFNLIQNAIRHTPADGSVVVRATRAGGGIEIEVVDTGEGIASQDRERVFEPFVTGSTAGARTGGAAGLGLAIARAIVEAHGGRIWLADVPRGTCVRFSLPVAADAAVGR